MMPKVGGSLVPVIDSQSDGLTHLSPTVSLFHPLRLTTLETLANTFYHFRTKPQPKNPQIFLDQ